MSKMRVVLRLLSEMNLQVANVHRDICIVYRKTLCVKVLCFNSVVFVRSKMAEQLAMRVIAFLKLLIKLNVWMPPSLQNIPQTVIKRYWKIHIWLAFVH